MSRTLPLAAVGTPLRELIAGMVPGEELVLTDHGEPVAILMRPQSRTSWPCEPGSARDRAFWMAPDLDASVEDFDAHPRQPGNCAGMLTIVAEDDDHLADFADSAP